MIDVLVDNVMVNCLNMYLRSLAEMRPKLAVGSGNGYFLVVHNYDVVSGCKNREKNIMIHALWCNIALDYPIGTANFKTKFLPMLNTPRRPVTTFKSAYFRRLRWSW